MRQWYYSQEGQQKGPVPVSELQRLAATGGFDPDSSLVWTDGMPDWVAASTIPELAPATTSPGPPPVGGPSGGARATAQPSNPYATPTSSWEDVPSSSVGDLPYVKPANYALFAGCTALGMVGFIAGLVVMFMTIDEGTGEDVSPVSLGIFALSAIPLIAGTVLALIYQYRAWLLLQPHTRFSTPGKAVGFQFIPFFSLYWYFVAYWRWAQEWNRLIVANPGHRQAPRASEGLFLAYAVLQIAAIIVGAFASLPMIVIYFIIMKNVCDAVNYGAANSQPRP